MFSNNELDAALPTLPTSALQGTAFRSVRQQYANAPLSAIGSLLLGGRYNFRGEFEALYLADSELTARKEVRVLFETSAGIIEVQGPPRVMFCVEYQLNAVLDITDPSIQSALGTNFQELTGLWEPMQRQNQPAPTQRLGTAAYRLGSIEALKVPSAQAPTAYNLIIFPDRLSGSAFVRLVEP